MNTDSIKLKDAFLSQTLEAAKGVIANDEVIIIALKGAFKEYLICTDKSVHIIKKGFMTGHTFGNGDFKMPYLSSVESGLSCSFHGDQGGCDHCCLHAPRCYRGLREMS